MKKFPLILLTLFLAYVPAPLFADEDLYTQYLPEYMPQAPNAQAIARAIEIPVNFYTGIPNISIPLYDIKVGNISVPITLSYQGGGIRPSQEATSVGLGWNLNAGGAITRTVKCADDFMEYYVSNSQFTVGFFGRSDWPDFSINFDYNYYRKVQHGYDGLTPYWTYHLYVDSEPDLFFYNIPGCSGKFSFKKDMSILNFDEENHVDINFTPQVNYFYVIDAQGTSYWFETKERTEVYSGGDCSNINTTPGGVDITAFGPNDHLTEVSEYTSTWYLTKIVSATNDTVDFEYEDETFMLPIQENCYYLRRVEGAAWNQDGDGPQYSRTKTNVDSKRLTHIRWRGGYVDFEYDMGRQDLIGDSKALTAVKVYNANNLLVSHWKMSYGYFNNNLTGIANNRKHLFKRLRLNTIKDMLSPQDPYQFGYYDEVALPLKNTKNLDYWGYYNGVNQGNNYYCPAAHNIIQSSKSANDHYSKVGILESIKHPTGGTTNLYWECNKTGESIFIENSITSGNHDSYTRGCLHAYRGGSTYDEERKKAVLLTEQSEIYLLLTTHYSGSQPSTTPIGTPFSIVKVNNDGTRTPCHSWSRGCVSDESEHTVTLAPGIYEFKCSATADDMEYYMYFTDSKNKFATRKSHDELIFCYRGTELTGIPDTVSQTVTLNRGEVVFLNYFSETVGNVTVSDLSDTSPFSIHRRKTDGTYEQVTSWTIPGVNMDENMTMHLDAGTYRIQCNAVADNVALGMTLQYGDVQYSPVNMNSLYHDWTSKVLFAYSEGTVSNEFDLEEEESDTITLLKPSRLYFDWFYEDMTGSAVSPSLMNTQPVSVYKRLASGAFEKQFCVPASSFADIDDIGREASGLYLPAGTYVVKCEATDDDIIFCASFAYRSDGIYSNNGANRGGLRIARISGEKDVTYLYEGGKEIIPPCTFYKEKRWYEHEGITSEVTYEVQPSESIRTMSTLKNGNVTGYSRVVQVFADKSRMEYTYHNEEEELVDADFPYSPTLTDWENGLLQTETAFNVEGDTVSHTSNAYMLKLVQPTYMFGFKEVRPRYNVNYFNKVECPLLSHAATTEFRDNGKYTVRRKYLYNDNLLCTEVSTTIGQDVQKVVYKYANDFTDDVSQQMVWGHQIGVPVAQLSMRNGVFYSGSRTVFGEFGQLADNSNTLLLGGSPNLGATYQRICQPRMLLTLNTSTATGSFSSCQFDTIIVYNGYTRFGKVRDLVYKGMPISYVWSYEGLFPVAEFKNAT
nr:hypothetical protein [Bacteroidales bacterium]